MFGFFVFEKVLANVGEKCRNKIIENIFGIEDVSVSDLIVGDDRIVFRIFSRGVFYQYSFVIGVGENMVESSEGILSGNYFISEDSGGTNEFICCLIKCQDEYQVYYLVRQYV